MKRIDILLTVFSALLFVACSSPNLKEVALERSKKYITPYDEHVRVVYSGDSICVIQRSAVMSDEREAVGKETEYYLMWTSGVNEEKTLVEYYYELPNGEGSLLESYGYPYPDVSSNDRLLRANARYRHRDLYHKVE